MANKQVSQIIGIRLDPQLARQVKAEAARRGIGMNKLFQELWASYKPPVAR
jgi:hypothetical protein